MRTDYYDLRIFTMTKDGVTEGTWGKQSSYIHIPFVLKKDSYSGVIKNFLNLIDSNLRIDLITFNLYTFISRILKNSLTYLKNCDS